VLINRSEVMAYFPIYFSYIRFLFPWDRNLIAYFPTICSSSTWAGSILPLPNLVHMIYRWVQGYLFAITKIPSRSICWEREWKFFVYFLVIIYSTNLLFLLASSLMFNSVRKITVCIFFTSYILWDWIQEVYRWWKWDDVTRFLYIYECDLPW